MERINKLLAHAGVASRRGVDELIRRGEVSVNGRIVTELGTRIDPAADAVKVGGRRVDLRPQRPTYLVLHKPRGVVTTLSDPQGRTTVRDLLRGVRTRLFPVGRLDYASEGLLLMTNDGELARALTHPSSHVPKTYRVKVRGRIAATAVEKLRRGVHVEGKKTLPAEVARRPGSGGHDWLTIVLREGRNQQIRKMLQAVGHPVLKLRRVAVDGVELGTLPSGSWRPLTHAELGRLRAAVRHRPSRAN